MPNPVAIAAVSNPGIKLADLSQLSKRYPFSIPLIQTRLLKIVLFRDIPEVQQPDQRSDDYAKHRQPPDFINLAFWI